MPCCVKARVRCWVSEVCTRYWIHYDVRCYCKPGVSYWWTSVWNFIMVNVCILSKQRCGQLNWICIILMTKCSILSNCIHCMFVLHPDVIVVFEHFFCVNSVFDMHTRTSSKYSHPNGADQWRGRSHWQISSVNIWNAQCTEVLWIFLNRLK